VFRRCVALNPSPDKGPNEGRVMTSCEAPTGLSDLGVAERKFSQQSVQSDLAGLI